MEYYAEQIHEVENKLHREFNKNKLTTIIAVSIDIDGEIDIRLKQNNASYFLVGEAIYKYYKDLIEKALPGVDIHVWRQIVSIGAKDSEIIKSFISSKLGRSYHFVELEL